MPDMGKFLNAAETLIELIADFNDINPSSHAEDILQIHAEEVVELWSTVILVYSRYMDGESDRKKTRPQSQESEEEADLVRARYKVCYEAYVKCRGNIKGMIQEFLSSTSKSKAESNNDTE